MVVGNKESTATKNAGESMAISIAMAIVEAISNDLIRIAD